MTTWTNTTGQDKQVSITMGVSGKGKKTDDLIVTHKISPGAKFTYDETASNGPVIAAQLSES